MVTKRVAVLLIYVSWRCLLRILLLTLYFAPDPAANAVIMTELAEQLAALGHEVTVVAAFPHYDTNRIWDAYRGKLVQREQHGPVCVYRTYLYVPGNKTNIVGRLLNYLSFNLLSALVAAWQPRHDVILAPSPPLTNGMGAFFVSRLRGIPYVYNVQDIYPDIAIRLGLLTNPTLIRHFRWMEDFVYRHAAAVTVLSDGFRRNLHQKGVPETKLAVIPNFIDVDFVRPGEKDNPFSRAHGWQERFVVMYAGNIGLSQNLQNVLAAAALLQNHPQIHFLLVGNGAAKESLRQQAQAMALDNVTFLPFQPRESLPDLYATADVSLVSLSRDIGSESVPSKAYTIMASGRPLLAAVSHDAETRLLVQQANCGLWVDPDDPAALAAAVLNLRDRPALRAEMGVNGRRYVEQHHVPHMVARQYAALLRQLAPPSALTAAHHHG